MLAQKGCIEKLTDDQGKLGEYLVLVRRPRSDRGCPHNIAGTNHCAKREFSLVEVGVYRQASTGAPVADGVILVGVDEASLGGSISTTPADSSESISEVEEVKQPLAPVPALAPASAPVPDSVQVPIPASTEEDMFGLALKRLHVESTEPEQLTEKEEEELQPARKGMAQHEFEVFKS